MSLANRAALFPGPGKGLEVTEVSVHHPGPGEVSVRNHAIAVQPLDARMLLAGYTGGGALQSFPALLGANGAGEVEELGDGVAGLGVGDRVVFDTKAYVEGDENRRQGTWQQLVIVNAKTVAKIGDIAYEQAVLTDWPMQTAVAALHLYLGMGTPGSGSSEEKVLIWGAGGAVGSYAVQYAKSVGHTVVVTANPSRDLERQKRLGASEIVDYKVADAVDRLRELGPYRYLFTTSGDATSQKALASLLPQGGKFASVLGGDVDLPSNVERVYLAFSLAAQQDENSEWRAFWYHDLLPKVLQENVVEPVKFTKVPGGLAALQQASEDVFGGKAKGKLIINPQE